MSPLVTALNNFITAWIAEQAAGGTFAVKEFTLHETGGRLRGWVDLPPFRGEVVIDLIAEAPQGNRQAFQFRVESWPADMPALLEALRRVLETARIRVELEFPR